MYKKILTTLTVILFGASIASAQSIPTISPWKWLGGVISPAISSSSVKIPSLGSTGNPCVKVDSTGLLATTTCGSGGGGTPASPSGSIQFNNSGSFGGSANATLDSSGNIIANSIGAGSAAHYGGIAVNKPDATLEVNDTSGATDEKNWYFQAVGSRLYWGAAADSFGAGQNYTSIGRSGNYITDWNLLDGLVPSGTMNTSALRLTNTGYVGTAFSVLDNGYGNMSVGASVDGASANNVALYTGSNVLGSIGSPFMWGDGSGNGKGFLTYGNDGVDFAVLKGLPGVEFSIGANDLNGQLRLKNDGSVLTSFNTLDDGLGGAIFTGLATFNGNIKVGSASITSDGTNDGIFIKGMSIGDVGGAIRGFAINRNVNTGSIFNSDGGAAQFTVNYPTNRFSMQPYTSAGVSPNTGSGNYDSFSVDLTNGRFGIWQQNPAYPFDVGDNAHFAKAIYDSASSAGSSGYVLSSTGTSTKWFNLLGTANGWTAVQNFASATFSGNATSSTIVANNNLSVGTSSTIAKVTVAGGSILNAEVTDATSTSMIMSFATSTAQTIRLGTGAITVNLKDAVAGAVLRATVCNPSGTAGALTWVSSTTIHWMGGNTVPTQTTTANVCDLWTFTVTNGTSTPIILGAQLPW